MSKDLQAVLQNNLLGMRKSIHWLKRSYEKCRLIGLGGLLSEDEFDTFDNLVGRYARTLDIIVGEVFRSIDAVELEEAGALIDAVNRAEKRGLVSSAVRVRDLKDLRNDIVHEYETDDLRGLFEVVLKAVPELFAIAEKTERYCAKFSPG